MSAVHRAEQALNEVPAASVTQWRAVAAHGGYPVGDDVPEFGLELPEVAPRKGLQGVEEDVKCAVRIAMRDAFAKLELLCPYAVVQSTDHPEVHEAEATVFKEEQVRRVGVGVKNSVMEELLQHGPEYQQGQRIWIDQRGELAVSAGSQRLDKVLERNPFQLFHCNDVPSAVPLINPRSTVIDVVARERIVHQLGVPGLTLKIELGLDGGSDDRDHSPQVELARQPQADDRGGRESQDGEVDANPRIDAWLLDLDHNRSAVGKPGAMHLGDGRRADGGLGECWEDILQRFAQVRLDDCCDRLHRQGCEVIQQAGEAETVTLGKKVVPHREKLAELHEAGPARFQVLPKDVRANLRQEGSAHGKLEGEADRGQSEPERSGNKEKHKGRKGESAMPGPRSPRRLSTRCCRHFRLASVEHRTGQKTELASH